MMQRGKWEEEKEWRKDKLVESGVVMMSCCILFFFFQAEDGIRVFCLSGGLGDVYKRQGLLHE